MKHILQCKECKAFTMEEKCSCGGKAESTKPMRYSPGKFAEYRQKARKEELVEKGLL